MDSMYDILLQSPLFQGVSRNKISEIIEKTRFHFLKYQPDELIVRTGEECTHAKFLISGSARSEMINKSGKIKVTEVMHAPNIIAPTHIFGRSTAYPSDLIAVTPTGIMQIDKQDFIQLLQTDSIFLINLLNIISRRSQKSMESFLSLSSGDVKARLAFWILSFTQRNSTDIRIICKQKDLYSFFGVQRSVFMHALNSLQEEGVIEYSTREIVILDRHKLRDILNGNIDMDSDDDSEL